MELVDYRHFAAPISDDSPAGEDLEYDADFLKVIEILSPPAVAMVATDEDDAPDQTDWNAAVSLCTALADKTRDLRVAVRLARCSIKSEQGISGFAGAVNAIAELVENLWSDVHPVLDIDDNMDATMRFNALNELSDDQVVKDLSFAPIAFVGRETLCLNDIELSIGKAKAKTEEDQTIASGKISEIFSPANSDSIVTVKAVADGALNNIERIRTIWSSNMDGLMEARHEEGLSFDTIPAPQFEGLIRVLGDISRHIAERLPEEEEAVDLGADGVKGAAKTSSGAIETRADADRAITKVIEWFRRNEPSSPVPVMLERAKSMISKSFLEIVDELGEGGIAEAKKATGATETEEQQNLDG